LLIYLFIILINYIKRKLDCISPIIEKSDQIVTFFIPIFLTVFKFYQIKMTIEIFEKWINVLIKPKEVFAEEKANASLGKAIKIIFVAGIITGIFQVIASFILFAFFETTFHRAISSYDTFFGRALSLPEYLTLSFVSSIIFALIFFLIGSGMYYIFAKLLKGKGNFTTQTYLVALVSAPCMVIVAAINIIPFMGMILSLFVGIYELYLLTLALREVHQYSTGRAILSWLIPAIVLVVIAFVILIMGFFILYDSFMNSNI